ncbi:hercynylcysteine sulfoxide lyase-like [Haliotis rufescens]|uniref:hercynylcysteine sulfoxide lyase-like n=1 Tax=Haliotis rufescens TaxID=6454 RepID=UPI00201EFC72|nr:hercynylcysteine sulfoxide lyase-like [Haliotis rufescens]
MKLENLHEAVEFGAKMREEFSLQKGETFLNNGSFGAVPNCVQEVQRRFREEIERHPDDWYRRSVYKYWHESQKAVADFMHCDPQDLVCVQNATTGLNTVLKCCPYKPGDILMYTTLTFRPIAYTCQATADLYEGVKTFEMEIKFPISSDDEICEKYEDFFKSNPNTKIAILDAITSPSAVVMPLKRLVTLCHRYGVLAIVDGAHAPGLLPVNLTELGADAFIGSFHKWMFTPKGCAILYVKREHHAWVHPLVTSWNHGLSLEKRFFIIATEDQTPFITAKYAVEFYQRIGGMDKIISYTSKLASEAHEYILKKLRAEPLQIPQSMESPTMRVIRLPDLSQYPCTLEGSIAFHTDIRYKYNIQCAIELIQGHLHLRISTQVYNTLEEYKRLADCLLEVIQADKNYKTSSTRPLTDRIY